MVVAVSDVHLEMVGWYEADDYVGRASLLTPKVWVLGLKMG